MSATWVGAMILGFANAPSAAAAPIAPGDYLWNSHITKATIGFQSRRWEDSSYSEILFQGCDDARSVTVQMRMDVNNAPDKGYDKKTFTACFGLGWSQGEWTNLPDTSTNSSAYFFRVTGIGSTSQVEVDRVCVDNTLDDYPPRHPGNAC
ncbi:hypothetical protein [Streptomyces parvus]|uniref:hypothetical protein n=1 Tax=Streptomyces parvus TaxID=66428 RepID=UPI00362C88E0